MSPLRLAVFAVAALSALSPVRAQTAGEWIAKARAYLGTDDALKAVTSVRFTGKLVTVERVAATDEPARSVEVPAEYPVDIVFQHPYRQRIVVTLPKYVETTALDGYEAWQRRTEPAAPTQWNLKLLDAGQVKRLRANTWENLSFFSDPAGHGGTVAVTGDATVDGVACVKLAFSHGENILFLRYFEKATGRLVRTETETGGEIREEGESVVNGIRFPKKILNKAANGSVTTLIIDRIVLNEASPAEDFAVPTLLAN